MKLSTIESKYERADSLERRHNRDCPNYDDVRDLAQIAKWALNSLQEAYTQIAEYG